MHAVRAAQTLAPVAEQGEMTVFIPPQPIAETVMPTAREAAAHFILQTAQSVRKCLA